MRSSVNTDRRVGVLRRTAKEVRHYKVMMRLLSAALGGIVALLAMSYTVAVLYKRTGSFTVTLNKYQTVEYGLQLSESREMLRPTTTLDAAICENITNITEAWLPDTLGDTDGEDNGDNYICYTFYAQNSGEATFAYEYSVDISNITRMLDEAVRIRVYKDGEPTTYAKTASDGSGAEPGTTAFYSNSKACLVEVEDFKPGDIAKFTVVIWIEGNDPDCIDWLIDGELKAEMNIRILER